jgi:hypothetical protein
MEKHEWITLSQLRSVYDLEDEFLEGLRELELIRFNLIDNQECIERDELVSLERFLRLRYDLEINLEGIDVINQLLARIAEMEREIRQLKGQLKINN